MGDPLITDLIVEMENAMKETSPALSSFNLFNPEALDKLKENWKGLLKTLCHHYGLSINNSYEGQVTTAIPRVSHSKGEGGNEGNPPRSHDFFEAPLSKLMPPMGHPP